MSHVSDTLCEEGATLERSMQAPSTLQGADEASSPELAPEQASHILRDLPEQMVSHKSWDE